MVWTGRITRTELGLADLVIVDGVYVLDNDGPGELEVTWRRQRAQSPFVDGSVLVGKVRDDATMSLAFNVLGDTVAQARDAADVLLAAVQQTSWNLYLNTDTEEFGWACECADYTVGMVGHMLRAAVIPVRLSVPRKPVALAGGSF